MFCCNDAQVAFRKRTPKAPSRRQYSVVYEHRNGLDDDNLN